MLKKTIKLCVLIGIVFIGLSRALGLTDGGIESIASYVSYPFLALSHAIVRPFTSWQARRTLMKRLLAEYEELVKERDSLLKKVVEFTALKNYADATKDMRAFMKRYTEEPIIAPILLKNFAGEDFYLVDAGENFGVQKGMIALYNNHLIGKVTEVYPYYSKVFLISNPHCNVAAYCSSSCAEGLHHGLKQGLATLSYVDHRDDVLEGDLVFSSGKGGLLPRGFVLGRVSSLKNTGYDRSIIVQPFYDLTKLDYCALAPNTITRLESDA